MPSFTPFDFTVRKLYLDYQWHTVNTRSEPISRCGMLIALINSWHEQVPLLAPALHISGVSTSCPRAFPYGRTLLASSLPHRMANTNLSIQIPACLSLLLPLKAHLQQHIKHLNSFFCRYHWICHWLSAYRMQPGNQCNLFAWQTCSKVLGRDTAKWEQNYHSPPQTTCNLFSRL